MELVKLSEMFNIGKSAVRFNILMFYIETASI